jgi:hypothetical protein
LPPPSVLTLASTLTAPLSCPATHYLPLQRPKLSHALETCNRFLSAGDESADKRLQHIVFGLRTRGLWPKDAGRSHHRMPYLGEKISSRSATIPVDDEASGLHCTLQDR